MKRLAKKKKLERMEPWAGWIRDLVGEITYPLLEEYHYLRQQHFQVDNPEKFIEMFALRKLSKLAIKESNAKWMNGCREWDINNGYGDSTFPLQEVPYFSHYVLIKKIKEYNQHFHCKLWGKFNQPFQQKLTKKYLEQLEELPDNESLDDLFEFCAKIGE